MYGMYIHVDLGTLRHIHEDTQIYSILPCFVQIIHLKLNIATFTHNVKWDRHDSRQERITQSAGYDQLLKALESKYYNLKPPFPIPPPASCFTDNMRRGLQR